ncbi:MAG: carboxypeptidase regulatory-like domain-containing protein [Gemmatimonadetes bacterium]|nr:carboxypeptidase regulatory-like domain-containing protein [Gemmatimonadota bacterium]
MIGRETQTSAAFTLDTGVVEPVRLSLASHAIPLSKLQVEVEGRCRLRPDEASIVRVWQEARKALQVQAWARREGRYEFEVSTYERRLDASGRSVEKESRSGTSVVGVLPFASLTPEELATEGFVRRLAGGGHQYYGPDASVLLSDAFLDTHCFGLTRSPARPGWIGLTFKPADDGDRRGIRGTFWLDEERTVFGLIEYHYVWSPHVEAEGVGGGRVEFTALPDGAWMIERWSIRAPILARRPALARGGDDGVRMIAIHEMGGEVVRVTNLDDRQSIETAARGSLRGVVWDSTTSTPLAGARLRLAGTAYEVVTDSAGRFVMERLPAGVFTVTVEHPRLDSLGTDVSGTQAEVIPGQTTALALATPSMGTLLVTACQAKRGEPKAVVWGVVRSSAGDPVPGAEVQLDWGAGGRMEVGANNEGWYTACDVPVDRTLSVRASFLGWTGEATELAAGEEPRRLDLVLPLAAGVLTVGSDTVVEENKDRRGRQGIQGHLVELGGGRHVGFAEIMIRSSSGRVLATGTTDEKGLFRLLLPEGGRFLFSANALGYKSIEDQVVEVEPENITVLEVRMAAEALGLAPIMVTTEARSFRLEREGFYLRRDQGVGIQITPEVIERRRPQKTTDLFFGIPGARVIEPAGGGRGRAVRFRTVLEWCWPMVYVDRHLVSTGGSENAGAEPLAIDDVVFTADIFAIEVFRSPAEIPSEFNGPNAGCGVVVLWTRRGGGG